MLSVSSGSLPSSRIATTHRTGPRPVIGRLRKRSFIGGIPRRREWRMGCPRAISRNSAARNGSAPDLRCFRRSSPPGSQFDRDSAGDVRDALSGRHAAQELRRLEGHGVREQVREHGHAQRALDRLQYDTSLNAIQPAECGNPWFTPRATIPGNHVLHDVTSGTPPTRASDDLRGMGSHGRGRTGRVGGRPARAGGSA